MGALADVSMGVAVEMCENSVLDSAKRNVCGGKTSGKTCVTGACSVETSFAGGNSTVVCMGWDLSNLVGESPEFWESFTPGVRARR